MSNLYLSRSQLKELLSIDILPRRFRDAFHDARDANFNQQRPFLTFAKELLLPTYKKQFQEEGADLQTLRGSFRDNAIEKSDNALFYSVGQHFDLFQTVLNVGIVHEGGDAAARRLIPRDLINVYARPNFLGKYKIEIAPGSFGLVTPFDNDVRLKTLKILGQAIEGVKNGTPITPETLRERLIEEAGLEPSFADIPHYTAPEMKIVNP